MHVIMLFMIIQGMRMVLKGGRCRKISVLWKVSRGGIYP
jgi:hypothetical protein